MQATDTTWFVALAGVLMMGTASELGAVTYRHRYVSMKRLTWATMAITATMGLLYFVVGFPPAFDTYHEKIYFHSIGIGLAALAVYLIVSAFDLERHEPPLDFPISYRTFGAVVFAALGGIAFLTPSVTRAVPHVGMLLFVSAFILITDVGGALLIELLVLPRKLAGTYRSESHNPMQYLMRLVPGSRADVRAYRGRTLGYWLTLIGVASFFIAELIGFVNLWVREIGPSFMGRYIAWLGLDRKGFLDATLDPHSHMIAIAIMAGIVGGGVALFRLTDAKSKISRVLTRVGVAVAILGVVATTLVLSAVGFLNWSPPTFFKSGPDGINGMPGDDAAMAVVLLGALIVGFAIFAEQRVRRDPVKVLFGLTWVSVFAITLIEGVYIELHETIFQNSAAAKDAAFSTAHPMTGIFLLPTVAVGLALLAHYPIGGLIKRVAAWMFGFGLATAVAGSTLWTFVDPSKSGAAFWTYITGTVVSYCAIFVTAFSIRQTKVETYERVVGVAEPTIPTISEARRAS